MMFFARQRLCFVACLLVVLVVVVTSQEATRLWLDEYDLQGDVKAIREKGESLMYAAMGSPTVLRRVVQEVMNGLGVKEQHVLCIDAFTSPSRNSSASFKQHLQDKKECGGGSTRASTGAKTAGKEGEEEETPVLLLVRNVEQLRKEQERKHLDFLFQVPDKSSTHTHAVLLLLWDTSAEEQEQPPVEKEEKQQDNNKRRYTRRDWRDAFASKWGSNIEVDFNHDALWGRFRGGVVDLHTTSEIGDEEFIHATCTSATVAASKAKQGGKSAGSDEADDDEEEMKRKRVIAAANTDMLINVSIGLSMAMFPFALYCIYSSYQHMAESEVLVAKVKTDAKNNKPTSAPTNHPSSSSSSSTSKGDKPKGKAAKGVDKKSKASFDKEEEEETVVVAASASTANTRSRKADKNQDGGGGGGGGKGKGRSRSPAPARVQYGLRSRK